MEITVKNKAPIEDIPVGTSFLTVISKGTEGNLFSFTYIYWESYFLATNSRKIWFL
jgi:hypothetical protein